MKCASIINSPFFPLVVSIILLSTFEGTETRSLRFHPQIDEKEISVRNLAPDLVRPMSRSDYFKLILLLNSSRISKRAIAIKFPPKENCQEGAQLNQRNNCITIVNHFIKPGK